jgi:nucleolin
MQHGSILQIRGALEQHFGSCGEITRLSVPKDYDTGEVKGFVLFPFSIFYFFSFALKIR